MRINNDSDEDMMDGTNELKKSVNQHLKGIGLSQKDKIASSPGSKMQMSISRSSLFHA